MMRLAAGAMMCAVLASPACAADVQTLIRQIKAAGPDGAGSGTAAAAWVQLKEKNIGALVPLMAALDDATPLAANWLRSAIDAIVDRERQAGVKLPATELESFLNDKKHAGSARRLAFELLCQADPGARARLLPGLIKDPAPELRYDAIDSAFEKLRKLEKPNPETYEPGAAEEKAKKLDRDEAAIAALKTLLQASRHFEQTAILARELEAYGEKIDLTDHFGFQKRWWVVSTFDNTDGKGFATVFPPERKLDRSATAPGKKGEATTWKLIDSKEQFGTIDLNKQVGKIKNAVAYAVTEVECDTERPAHIRAASITAIKIFVNGKEVLARESYHQGMSPDTHIAPVTLKPGRNIIMLKLCQNDQSEPWAQDWKFQCRISEPDGAKLPVKNVTPETVQ